MMKVKCSRLAIWHLKVSIFNGFTLLEMLVVLVLVSLISVLMLQGLAYTLQLRTRFLVVLDDLQTGLLQAYWFRSTTEGLITDYKDGKNVFQGTAETFSGLTLAALDGLPGVPLPFAWEIQQIGEETRLIYRNQHQEVWEIGHWFGVEGEFQYRAGDGKWYTEWPPKFGLEPPQLPSMIVFNGKRRQTPITWIVKLVDFNKGRVDVREDQF